MTRRHETKFRAKHRQAIRSQIRSAHDNLTRAYAHALLGELPETKLRGGEAVRNLRDALSLSARPIL